MSIAHQAACQWRIIGRRGKEPTAGDSGLVVRSAVALVAARRALGGEPQLTSVRTVIVNGRTRLVRGRNLVPIECEIACELPDRYVRLNEIPTEETGVMKRGFAGDKPAVPTFSRAEPFLTCESRGLE